MLPALRYRGPLYCAPEVNRDNAHDPDRLVSDSGRMTGKAGGMPPVGQIAPDKRACVYEYRVNSRVVGDSYLGITSGLPVTRDLTQRSDRPYLSLRV